MYNFLLKWEKNNVEIDAVLIGYTCTLEQINQIQTWLDKNSTITILVDPAMADDGSVYNILSEKHVDYISKICNYANYITPNITEAFLLANKEYHSPPYAKNEIETIVNILYKKYTCNIVITGISLEDGFSVVGYDGLRFVYAITELIPQKYSGAGDAFSSLFLVFIMRGYDFKKTLELTTNLMFKIIEFSYKNQTTNLFFENIIDNLIKGKI